MLFTLHSVVSDRECMCSVPVVAHRMHAREPFAMPVLANERNRGDGEILGCSVLMNEQKHAGLASFALVWPVAL